MLVVVYKLTVGVGPIPKVGAALGCENSLRIGSLC